MIREIIKIDEEKCNGCGLCVPACVEGALKIIDGKAKLVSEVYCDGLGACIGDCPQGAISIERREAGEFDEDAVKDYLINEKKREEVENHVSHSCPGSALRTLQTNTTVQEYSEEIQESQLGHWPVQLMLIPPQAPFLKGADIIVCADCVPFTVPDFHQRYLQDRAVIVGCPKLDNLSYYREKFVDIFREASPKSITVLRMEVPCCGGIAGAVIEARDKTLPDIKVDVHTIGIKGDIHRDTA